jgi:peptide/nickel transport system permease protein
VTSPIVLLRYLIRRLTQAIPIVFGIVVLNFLLLQLAPGDAADVLAGEAGSATPEYMAQLRARFGLDQPVYIQLLLYIGNVVTLNLGFSFRHNMPVLELILGRLWPTLLLMGTTLVVSVSVGVLLGLLAATRVHSWGDNLISILAIIAYATPLFWIGLMLIVLFSINLGWFPASGMETVAAFYEGWDRVVDIAWHLVLPALTLSFFYLALYTRLMAEAKGLTERQITFRHILRNAILPVVTMIGIQLGSLLGGSVIVESVFGWPGLGLLAYQSLFARDFNLLLGIFFFSACLVVIVNLLVDLLYVALDPRIEIR